MIAPRWIKAMRSSKSLLVTLVLVSLLLLIAPSLLADENESRRTHFVDTTTDRTPAKTAFPKYPRIARRDRIEGDATVCFKIDARGRVRSVRLREASHSIFKRPALRAIRQSSFEPLAPNNVLAQARVCRTYRFRLEPVLAESREP